MAQQDPSVREASTDKEIPYGECHCGCGRLVNLAPWNSNDRGWAKGEPVKFMSGHNSKGQNNPAWKGGVVKENGYFRVRHPEAKKYEQYHRRLVEEIIGKQLPITAVVHHHNRDGYDNSPGNFVVCQDRNYHNLIHRRMRAYFACGHPTWIKCPYCKGYDDPLKMKVDKRGYGYHQSCKKLIDQKRPNRRSKRSVKND